MKEGIGRERGQSWGLYALNMGYQLVAIVVMDAILAVWA
jgi:hypothetical protein